MIENPNPKTAVCGIACAENQWSPTITPKWRPPSSGGWRIDTLPPEIADNPDNARLVWGYKNRKKGGAPNDANAGVNEIVGFLRLNGINVDGPLLKAIREHADRIWCARDPDRCPKRRSIALAVEGVVVAPIMHSSAWMQPAQSPTKPCGGCR